MLTLMLLTSSSILFMKNKRWKWVMISSMFSFATFMSMNLFNKNMTWSSITLNLGVDTMSTPLMVLSIWLVPLCLLANKKMNTTKKKNMFMFLIALISIFLMMTFSSLKMLSFFIFFEATLMPTLLLIMYWGKKMERLNAGLYFIFYTLIGSLPLLMSMIMIKNKLYTLMLPLLKKNICFLSNSLFSINLWWLLTIMAFLMKMPMYGFHLWLPKAHVEAPVAGSMLLAAMLLKLGGYGLMRITMLFPKNLFLSNIMLMFCCMGALTTSMICLRQTDLKSLIAYSSVSHMSIVAMGILLKTHWSIVGALILMMGHGLVSSCLFALAKMLYERSHTRKMSISRGISFLSTLMPIWWLINCAANLGLPPLPKLMGEFLMLSGTISWNLLLMPFLGMTTMITAVYSLSMYQKLNNKNILKSNINFININPREHFLVMFHMLPLLPLIMSPLNMWPN